MAMCKLIVVERGKIVLLEILRQAQGSNKPQECGEGEGGREGGTEGGEREGEAGGREGRVREGQREGGER